jgi:hypothetical protein
MSGSAANASRNARAAPSSEPLALPGAALAASARATGSAHSAGSSPTTAAAQPGQPRLSALLSMKAPNSAARAALGLASQPIHGLLQLRAMAAKAHGREQHQQVGVVHGTLDLLPFVVDAAAAG